MVSFDVESLFTKISLEECIDSAVNHISEGNPDIKLNVISLHVLAVMPVTSVKPAGIFPHVLESTKSVTGPLTFSGI